MLKKKSSGTSGGGSLVAVSTRRERRKLVKRNWELYLFILPALVYFILFSYWPMYGVLIAFKRYNAGIGILQSPWAQPWYRYFKLFFDSAWFSTTIKNTLVLSLYGFVIGNILPLLLALMINEVQNMALKKTVQTVTYLPYFISEVVLVGLINLMFADKGVVNHMVTALGGTATQFLSSDAAFPHLYVWSGAWVGTGYGAIIYFAALSNVNPELYEAAVIDGASRFQRIIHVTIPAIIPTFVMLLILGAGSIMSVSYTKVLLMQTTTNLEVSEVINTYVYKVGLLRSQYSLATAVGLFNNIINLLLLVIVNKISRTVSDIALW